MSAADILRAAEAARIAAENAPPPLTMEQLQANRAAAAGPREWTAFGPSGREVDGGFVFEEAPPVVATATFPAGHEPTYDEIAQAAEATQGVLPEESLAAADPAPTPPAILTALGHVFPDVTFVVEPPAAPTIGIPEAEAFAAALAHEEPVPKPSGRSKRSK